MLISEANTQSISTVNLIVHFLSLVFKGASSSFQTAVNEKANKKFSVCVCVWDR